MSCKMKKAAAVFSCMTLAICLGACGNSGKTDATDSSVQNNFSYEDMFTSRDLEGTYEEKEAVSISLADGASESDSEDVKVEKDTITILGEGVYVLSGSLSDGQIVVDADKSKVQLVFSDVSVSNGSTAAIYVKNADKVFVTLKEGTTNTLSVTGEFTAIDDNNIDGVIYSKDDLCFNGAGTLLIDCANGHGIVSKDDLKVTGGTYEIMAAGHALSGKDSVRIANGSFTLSTGTSAIHSENEEEEENGYIYIADGLFTISSEGKGINATAGVYLMNGIYEIDAKDDTIHSDEGCIVEAGDYVLASGDDGIHAGENLIIGGGTITISESCEGLEGMTVTINDGDIRVVSSDDGINAAGGTDDSGFAGMGDFGGQGSDMFGGTGDTSDYWIEINGGNILINAGGDGIDSNGCITFHGGTVYISGPTDDMNAALDPQSGMTVNGGTIIAAGAFGMAENFSSDSTQGAMLINYGSSMSGTITLCDADGNELASFTPEKTYSCVQISCPDIAVGKTYTVTSGTDSQTIEMTELIYGKSGGMGMMGGPGGNRQDFGETGAAPNGEDWNEGNMLPNGERPDWEQGNMEPPFLPTM